MENLEDELFELSEDEVSRYARHISLPQVGISGQLKLKQSSVLCIGAGGLGSPLLLYLAAVGVGRIGIIDYDLVEESNLQRQVIHSVDYLGNPKTSSAKERIMKINPYCQVDIYSFPLTNLNALELIDKYQVVCDCTDNFPSRYLINDACIILGKPYIYGSIQAFQGQVTVFNLHPESSPNYRDLLPYPPPLELIPSCADGGVLGVLPGIIGLIQATETIKIIANIGDSLDGRLLVFDALSMRFKELNIVRSFDPKMIVNLIDYEEFCSNRDCDDLIDSSLKCQIISVSNLKQLISNGDQDLVIIDVRETSEYDLFSLPGSISIPAREIHNGSAIENIKKLSQDRQICLYCKTGHRSSLALKKLTEHKIGGLTLEGGVDAWRRNELAF